MVGEAGLEPATPGLEERGSKPDRPGVAQVSH